MMEGSKWKAACTFRHMYGRTGGKRDRDREAGQHSHIPDADLGLPVSRKRRQGRMRALKKAMMDGGVSGQWRWLCGPEQQVKKGMEDETSFEEQLCAAAVTGSAGREDGIHVGIHFGTESCEEVCWIFLREQTLFLPRL